MEDMVKKLKAKDCELNAINGILSEWYGHLLESSANILYPLPYFSEAEL